MKVIALFLVITSLCAQDVYFKGLGLSDWVKLDAKFSAIIVALAEQPGAEYQGHGGLAVAPEAFFKIGDKTYEFYGGFMRLGDRKWVGEWMNDFWKYRFNKSSQEISNYVPLK